MPMTLTDLIALIEAGTCDEQRNLLNRAWRFVHGDIPEKPGKAAQEWFHTYRPFRNMLDAEAFESAALKLVPEKMFARVYCEAGQAIIVKPFSDSWHEVARSGLCLTPALAMLSAAFQAAATQRSNTNKRNRP